MMDTSIKPYVSIALVSCCFFFFNDTATTEIYTLSLHDALPICGVVSADIRGFVLDIAVGVRRRFVFNARSEEHTSELQSQSNLVCRLLLEKKTGPSVHSSPRRPRRF